jgi:CBS-domain-containing membrane protein
MHYLREETVAEVMVGEPKVLGSSATLDSVRALLADDHMHMVLLTEGGYLVGTVTREDLWHSDERAVHRETPNPPNNSLALPWARLAGRTIAATVPASSAFEAMSAMKCRRLAVIGEDNTLLGLLCLKAHGSGFCSDTDVLARSRDSRPFAGDNGTLARELETDR